jgi:hypothetical protein
MMVNGVNGTKVNGAKMDSLTCETQVKEFKKEIKNKFYIESIIFATFKTLNAQVLRKTFYICLLNLCPMGTS